MKAAAKISHTGDVGINELDRELEVKGSELLLNSAPLWSESKNKHGAAFQWRSK